MPQKKHKLEEIDREVAPVGRAGVEAVHSIGKTHYAREAGSESGRVGKLLIPCDVEN
jgi:hypothetical protein